MKKLLFLVLTLCFSGMVSAQAYLGAVTKQVNLREGPGTAFKTIRSLGGGTQVFVISLDAENDFYNVIDIASNKEGYVHKSFIKVGKQVAVNEGGLFTPSGTSSSADPEIEIYNKTSLELTLKLNDKLYFFAPMQKRTLTLESGNYEYRASAPGVIPNIGSESLEGAVKYTWQFYIVTRRR